MVAGVINPIRKGPANLNRLLLIGVSLSLVRLLVNTSTAVQLFVGHQLCLPLQAQVCLGAAADPAAILLYKGSRTSKPLLLWRQ